MRETENYFQRVEESAAWLSKRLPFTPDVVIVLSAGLGVFADALGSKVVIAAKDVPHFPVSRVEGHSGNLVGGEWKGKKILALQGRQHFYEGYRPQEIVFPYFVFHAIGTEILITTNATGGIRHDLDAGDVFVVTDHINMMGTNPLIGLTIQKKTEQFPSMIGAYDQQLRELAKKVAVSHNIALKEGVYVAVAGPSFETPAEIKMLRAMGADTVGMSTVFEVIAARYLDMRVLTLNAITNAAADRHAGAMTHEKHLHAMKNLSPKLVNLLRGIVEQL